MTKCSKTSVNNINDKILLSIKPEYTDKIIQGWKKFEYRTKKPKNDIKTIIIYSTSPRKQIPAEVEVKDIWEGTPEELWNKTSKYSGIEKDKYFKYFQKTIDKGKVGYAFVLGKVTCFVKQKTLKDYNCSFPPQSFKYVK